LDEWKKDDDEEELEDTVLTTEDDDLTLLADDAEMEENMLLAPAEEAVLAIELEWANPGATTLLLLRLLEKIACSIVESVLTRQRLQQQLLEQAPKRRRCFGYGH